MPVQIRAATLADIPRITEIYSHAILTGKASYEITPPDVTEMAHRMETITSQFYPYIVSEDGDGGLLGYAYASAFRTR